MNLVLTNAEDFKFAEERRLFYVAITRTKNRTFILTDNRNPSPFFKEFTASKSVCFISVRQTANEGQEKCPLCKTGNLLKVEHNGKSFVGCSNFPRCKYSVHDATVSSNPKKMSCVRRISNKKKRQEKQAPVHRLHKLSILRIHGKIFPLSSPNKVTIFSPTD